MSISALRTVALSVLAVAEGATTPVPSGSCWAWSSTLSKPVFWNGTKWSSATNIVVSVTAPSSPELNDLWLGI